MAKRGVHSGHTVEISPCKINPKLCILYRMKLGDDGASFASAYKMRFPLIRRGKG